MPYDDPDPADPNELVGVVLPGSPEAMRDMAYVFGEEFARMGMDESAILRLFETPFYGGAHQACRALGADEVRAIVRECVAVWGPAAGVIREAAEPVPGAPYQLPDPVPSRARSRPEGASPVVSTELGRN